MSKYRKKPVEIDAIEFEYSREGMAIIRDFCGDSLGKVSKDRHVGAVAEAEILTLEDGHDSRVKHVATEGDYIIKGVKGEFYPCKPDIFRLTYDSVLST